jgi:hypothetical protein
MRRESSRVHEQQIVAEAIQVAQDCAREVRLLVDRRRDPGEARVISSGASWTIAMQNNDALGSRPSDRADWSNAFEAVSRLAAAREATLQDIAEDDQGSSPAGGLPGSSNSSALSASPNARIDPDQLACAVAEIEQASAALRRSEPALEVWAPDPATHAVKRKYWSVWILIGGIWISATLVVAGATGAILFLLG